MARRGLSGGVLAVLVGLVAASAAQAHEPLAGLDVAEVVGPDARTIPGGYEIRLDDGFVMRTHGPDPASGCGLLDPCATGGTMPTEPNEDSPRCGSAGEARFEVLYAHSADLPNRLAQMTPVIQRSIRRINWKLRDSALRSSATSVPPSWAQFKVACNADSTPTVNGFATPPTATPGATSFQTIVQSARNAGFLSVSETAPRKYMIFFDNRSFHYSPAQYCGLGQVFDDPSTEGNPNNGFNRSFGDGRSMYSVTYSAAPAQPTNPTSCWDTYVPLHEALHTMGAVQNSAPFASGAYHCNDGIDVMCYPDGGPSSNYFEANCQYNTVDCGYDTYFDTNTEPGEYLRNAWNVGDARNRFLVFGTG